MIASIRDARRLEQARRQPVLPFTSIDVAALLEAVRREHFPELTSTPIVFVAPGPKAPLACIVNPAKGDRRIYLHAVLNDARCPAHVFALIAKHELAHAVVPSRKIDGRWVEHPPEFWDLERRIAPERDAAWEWVWEELGHLLEIDEKREGIYVRTSWRRRPSARECLADLGAPHLALGMSRSAGIGRSSSS